MQQPPGYPPGPGGKTLDVVIGKAFMPCSTLIILGGLPLLDVVLSYSTRRKTRSITLPETVYLIRLQGKGITAIDLSPLKHLLNLQELSLANNSITVLYMEPLKHCWYIERLWLRKNKLKTLDLSPLRFCKSLQLLDIEKNNIERLDVTPLFACTKLLVLDIDKNVELIANSRYKDSSNIPQALEKFIDRITWVDFDEILDFRLARLKLVLELYEVLRLEHMAELLRFPDPEVLDIWLEKLPDTLPLEIRGGEVSVLSSELPKEVEEYFQTGALVEELNPSSQYDFLGDKEGGSGIGVIYKRRLPEQSIFQLMRDAAASHDAECWRHAAIEGWTVIEALLSAIYEKHFGEPKPIELSYTKVIRKIKPHLPWEKLSEGMLLKSLKARNDIYPASEDPDPEDAEMIIAVAMQLCGYLNVELDELTPKGVRLLRVAASKPCPICNREMRAGQRTTRCPNCGINCHLEHLTRYVKTNGFCPNCRKALVMRRGAIEAL